MNDKLDAHTDDFDERKKAIEFEIEKGLLKLNKEQYKLCLSFLKAKNLHVIYPSEQNLKDGIAFLNYFFTQTFISIDKRILFFRNMQWYMRQEYIEPSSYDWLLYDKPACYFIWLYLKINLENVGLMLPNSGILTALSGEPQNSHKERYEMIKKYFSTFFGVSIMNLVENNKNYKKEDFELIYKKNVLLKLTQSWASYIKLPCFKWFFSGIPEVSQIVWKHIEENMPFYVVDSGNKKGKLSNKKEISYILKGALNTQNIAPISFEEMEIASYCSLGMWIYLDNPSSEKINALKKKISREISAKKLVAVKNIKMIKKYKV